MTYRIKFDFTTDRQQDLQEEIWPVSLAKRIIKAELGLIPCAENSGGDIRYETEDPEKFVELLKLAFAHSAGGWWSMTHMPEGFSVFYLPSRRG